jgi:hypothetical protein
LGNEIIFILGSLAFGRDEKLEFVRFGYEKEG